MEFKSKELVKLEQQLQADFEAIIAKYKPLYQSLVEKFNEKLEKAADVSHNKYEETINRIEQDYQEKAQNMKQKLIDEVQQLLNTVEPLIKSERENHVVTTEGEIYKTCQESLAVALVNFDINAGGTIVRRPMMEFLELHAQDTYILQTVRILIEDTKTHRVENGPLLENVKARINKLNETPVSEIRDSIRFLIAQQDLFPLDQVNHANIIFDFSKH